MLGPVPVAHCGSLVYQGTTNAVTFIADAARSVWRVWLVVSETTIRGLAFTAFMID